MSKLEPGLYRATVRDVANVLVFIGGTGLGSTAAPVRSCYLHDSRFITDARPLLVLDREDPIVAAFVKAYAQRPGDPTGGLLNKMATLIEVQIKPARIPEPGLYGVVDATIDDRRRRFVRIFDDDTGYRWLSPGFNTLGWTHLIDPTLVRDGVS